VLNFNFTRTALLPHLTNFAKAPVKCLLLGKVLLGRLALGTQAATQPRSRSRLYQAAALSALPQVSHHALPPICCFQTPSHHVAFSYGLHVVDIICCLASMSDPAEKPNARQLQASVTALLGPRTAPRSLGAEENSANLDSQYAFLLEHVPSRIFVCNVMFFRCFPHPLTKFSLPEELVP
jgi:hypothetical protein